MISSKDTSSGSSRKLVVSSVVNMVAVGEVVVSSAVAVVAVAVVVSSCVGTEVVVAIGVVVPPDVAMEAVAVVVASFVGAEVVGGASVTLPRLCAANSRYSVFKPSGVAISSSSILRRYTLMTSAYLQTVV